MVSSPINPLYPAETMNTQSYVIDRSPHTIATKEPETVNIAHINNRYPRIYRPTEKTNALEGFSEEELAFLHNYESGAIRVSRATSQLFFELMNRPRS